MTTDFEMKLVKPTKFRIKISNCGTDTLNGNYGLIEKESAMQLAFVINGIIIKDFVGKDNVNLFSYQLACILLDSLEGWNQEQLLEDIKNAKRNLDSWRLNNVNRI